MQHNHSRRAGSPGLTLSGVCQVSHLSHHPLQPPPPPHCPAPPPSLAPTWGRRKKRAFRPPDERGAQPITETHTDPINHARFCFKNNERSSLAAAVQTWRRRAAARRRRPVRAEPPPSLAATGSTHRAPSLFILSSCIDSFCQKKSDSLVYLFVFNNHFNIRHFFCLKLPTLGSALFS